MNQLEKFLSKNTVYGVGELPLVHSTRAFHLRSLQDSNRLVATPCDVFTKDKLNYFFVGRPAYKVNTAENQSQYWEFPCCFIFEYATIENIWRIFPFDSGAFSNKLYPSYTSMMKLDEFEVSSLGDAPGKIIGAFFGSAQRYLDLKPKDSDAFVAEHALGAMDMEIKALHQLAGEKSAHGFDDRRLTIEIQSNADVDLTVAKPLAVIAPSEFMDDPLFLHHVINVWGATPISYSINTLNVNQSYGVIYEKVYAFYKSKGLI